MSRPFHKTVIADVLEWLTYDLDDLQRLADRLKIASGYIENVIKAGGELEKPIINGVVNIKFPDK